jgi:RsiW-degrading membrane proteinase PrsW (M82 family)
LPPAGAPAPLAGVDPVEQALRRQRLVVRIVAGCVSLPMLGCVVLLIIGSVPNPLALALSAGAAVVPALVYALLILAIDRFEREPWRALLAAFAWGAVGAVLFSAVVGLVTGELLSAAFGERAGTLLNLGLGAPFIEESFKGVALLGLLLMFRAELDNVLDGLVYGALIGLGFAMTENILYFGQAYLGEGLGGLTQSFLVRAVLGGLGHALYTGTTGAAVGWARGQHGRGMLRFVAPVAGWSLAVFQHFLWNTGAVLLAALLGERASALLIVLVEATVFTLPALLVLGTVALVSARRESEIVREQLAEEVAAGVLTRRDYETLGDARARFAASRAAWRAGGFARWALQQRFHQAAAELAFRKYHRSRGEPLPGGRQELAEREHRAQLAALSRAVAAAESGSRVVG